MIMGYKKILAVLCCTALMAGCGNVSKESENGDISNIKKEDIVSISRGMDEYAESFSGITDLSENSEAVIYGEVLSVKYIVGENGLCRTNLEVKVLQSLKGDFHTGDTVKVAKDQGITSIKDYIDSFADEEMKEVNRENFSEYSDDELEKLYIEQIGENDIMSEVGQKSILFLRKSAFYEEEQTYSRLNGPEGEYTEVSEDQFVNTQTLGGELKPPYTLDDYEDEKADEPDDTYTLEKMMEEVDAAD